MIHLENISKTFKVAERSSDGKDVVKSFLSACEKHNFEKASKMYYDENRGKFFKAEDEYLFEPFDGRTPQKRSCFLQFLSSRTKFKPVHKGFILVTEKFWLSPKEAIFDKDNPNKCTVLVFVERKGVSDKETMAKSSDICITKEVEWKLEKINGKWAITSTRDSGHIYDLEVLR